MDVQDNSTMGIKATLSRLSDALKAIDRELWYQLDVKNQVGRGRDGDHLCMWQQTDLLYKRDAS